MTTPHRTTLKPDTAAPRVPVQRERATLTNSCRCGARWTGVAAAHCAAHCHLTFTSVSAFDRHRRNGECLTPDAAGLVSHERVGYLAWGWPGDDANTARLAAHRNPTQENR